MTDTGIQALANDLPFDPDALREKYRQERDKRIRADGNAQYVKTVDAFASYRDDPFVEHGFVRDPIFDDVEVLILGGGFAGLLMGARLREAGVQDLRIIDRAGDFGGTWYWNRYPGANCDIESYIYLPLLEETGYIPKHKYSYGPEIFEYCQLIGRQYDLYRNACFQTGLTALVWDEVDDRWIVTTDRGDRMRARFVVWGGGGANFLKLPGIPGITDFKGHTFHTSRWDYSYTGGSSDGNLTKLADKRVGIIGTGATAIQCVPHLGASAEQLYVFQRTPSSVDVRANEPTDPEWAKALQPGWQQRRSDNFISIIHGDGADEDLVADGWTEVFRNITGLAARRRAAELGRRLTSAERRELMELADFQKMESVRARAAAIVADPDIAESLKPWYRQFCKRPCFHDEYLTTFNRTNVKLIDTDGKGVERLTETGVVVAGTEYEVDCLIFATGFEIGPGTSNRIGCEVTGRGGTTLSKKWADRPMTLHGIQTHRFPNLFFVPGPLSARSFLIPYTYNEQAKHVAYILDAAWKRGATCIEADAEAELQWHEEVDRAARPGLQFYEACTPGYYNNEGRPSEGTFGGTAYEGGPTKYLDILRDWRSTGELSGVTVR